jgi:hypothetical protein
MTVNWELKDLYAWFKTGATGRLQRSEIDKELADHGDCDTPKGNRGIQAPAEEFKQLHGIFL